MVEQNAPGQKRTRKEVTIDWDERTVEESFNDVKTFASDLAEAIEDRLEANANVSSQCFDVGELFKLLCEKRLPDGRVKLNEGNLEEYGMEEFQVFFKEVCNLEHIKMLEDERFD